MVFDAPVSLPLAGSFVSCIIPRLLDYDHLDRDFEEEAALPSPPNQHFIGETEDTSDGDEDGDEDASEQSVRVSGGKFVVAKQAHPPSPTFGDMLLSKRSHQSSAFEVGAWRFVVQRVSSSNRLSSTGLAERGLVLKLCRDGELPLAAMAACHHRGERPDFDAKREDVQRSDPRIHKVGLASLYRHDWTLLPPLTRLHCQFDCATAVPGRLSPLLHDLRA